MVTFRRHYLDQLLTSYNFEGRVLDVGGERKGRRGKFTTPAQWTIVNPDPAAGADIMAFAEALPMAEGSYDTVVLTEVLEHMAAPDKVLRECSRVLKPGGSIVASVPFLYCVHGDPHDYTRWTSRGIEKIFGECGFSEIDIKPMGGIVATVLDLFENFCGRVVADRKKLPLYLRLPRAVFRKVLANWLLRLDAASSHHVDFCTGYFIKARK
jgi:SAM-dependent methyltransferase